MKEPTQPGAIVSRAEIRVMLGKPGEPMSRQRVSEVVEQDTFPAPLCIVNPGSEQPLWRRRHVEAWIEEHRRGPGRPAKAAPAPVTP